MLALGSKGTYTANTPLSIAPKPFFYSSELLEFGPGGFEETCRVGFERDDLHCSDRSQVRSHCRGSEREGIVYMHDALNLDAPALF